MCQLLEISRYVMSFEGGRGLIQETIDNSLSWGKNPMSIGLYSDS